MLYSALQNIAGSAYPISHPVRYSFSVVSALESLCAGVSQFNISKEQYLGGRNESLDRIELLQLMNCKKRERLRDSVVSWNAFDQR